MPAMPAMTVKGGLQLFDQFLKSVTEAVVERGGRLNYEIPESNCFTIENHTIILTERRRRVWDEDIHILLSYGIKEVKT